jgi:hypothetical protein
VSSSTKVKLLLADGAVRATTRRSVLTAGHVMSDAGY